MQSQFEFLIQKSLQNFKVFFGRRNIGNFQLNHCFTEVTPVLNAKCPIRQKQKSISKNELLDLKRNFGRVYSTIGSQVYTKPTSREDEMNQFMAVFPEIVRALTESPEYADIPDVTEWFAKNLNYNLTDGKKNRGIAVVNAYSIFTSSNLSYENFKLACVMGWCVEMLQAFYLVHDDIIDGTEVRRSNPCWYRVENNGLNAINDGVILELGIYTILQKYFRNKPYYIDVNETFHDASMKTTMGQILDARTCTYVQSTKKLDLFTADRYHAIIKYKTAYYTLHLPTALAMYMAGISSAERHKQAKDVLMQIGIYFQIQDDYLDCYAEKNILGKSGTDIQEGKCTWLIVTALSHANSFQRKKLEECYGNCEPEKVLTVKNIYEEIGLPKIYAAYEESTYNSLVAQIKLLPNNELPHDAFLKTLNNIYKRKY